MISRIVSRAEKEERRRSYRVYMSVAVPLLLLWYRCSAARILLKFRGSVGWNRAPLCSGWYAHIRTHAHTEAPFRSCHRTKTLKYGYCYAMAATSKADAMIQTHSSSRQHSTAKMKNSKKKLFLVPTAVGSYNDTHAHSRIRTQKHRSGLS